MARRSPDPDGLEAEIDRVRSLGLEGLRARWRTTFRSPPPPALTKDLMARGIAWYIQEQALGGPDAATLKLLDGLARGEKPESKRRLKTGTVLVREYQGGRHTVTVVPGGFLWRDTAYRSLSTVARAITGTAWNGPRFFGLRGPGIRAVGTDSASTSLEPAEARRTHRAGQPTGGASSRPQKASR
jgi:hypothetical protein